MFSGIGNWLSHYNSGLKPEDPQNSQREVQQACQIFDTLSEDLKRTNQDIRKIEEEKVKKFSEVLRNAKARDKV